MSFEQKLRDNIITPALESKGYGDLGVVIDYDSLNHKAEIKIVDSRDPTYGRQYKGVPMPFLNGIEIIDPYPGDKVWVQYYNGDKGTPYITALYPITQRQYLNHKTAKRNNLDTLTNL
jgi:hypothetical protein